MNNNEQINPIRILHVIGIMNRGGAETLIMNLYRNIDRKYVQFDFVENSSSRAAYDDEIEKLGGKIYRCPHYNGKNHIEYVKWWKNFFVEHVNEYVAVHGHLGSTAAIYLKIAKKYGVYSIAHSHNTNGKGLKNSIYQVFSFPTRFIADYFFACSIDAGESRYGKRVCNSDNFSVLHNAIDTTKFKYNPEKRREIRDEYNLSNKFVVGHVGRFSEQKNHKLIVDIFYKVYQNNNNAVLILVGDGELKEEIVSLVAEKNLSEAVIFTGVRENTYDFYQAMDVFLFPSLFEGLGIVAVEAQASGLPCVISDTVSRECIQNINQIKICNLNDKISKWAATVESFRTFNRVDCSEFVRQNDYDIKKISNELQNYYINLVKRDGNE